MIDRNASRAHALPGEPARLTPTAARAAARALLHQTLTGSRHAASAITDHLAAQSGKALRARLLLATAIGGDAQVPAAAVRAAAAIELLHLATLVHDDIIDDAPTRRGQASVQARFGRKAAVLGGDYLFCRCFSLVAEILPDYPTYFAAFSRGMTRVCLGEMEQLQHNYNLDLSMRGYLRIIAGKTAALFTLAAYGGAILAGVCEAGARREGRFGFLFGMLFQILDDCLDYEEDESRTRKTVRHDAIQGVVTPPLIFALARQPRLRAVAQTVFDRPHELPRLLQAVATAGGLEDAWALAGRYERKARAHLAQITDPARRRRLRDFLDQALGARAARLQAQARVTPGER